MEFNSKSLTLLASSLIRAASRTPLNPQPFFTGSIVESKAWGVKMRFHEFRAGVETENKGKCAKRDCVGVSVCARACVYSATVMTVAELRLEHGTSESVPCEGPEVACSLHGHVRYFSKP